MEREGPPPGAHAIVFVAMLLTLLGTCGVSRGIEEIRAPAELRTDMLEGSRTPLAIQEASLRTAEAVQNSSMRHGLATANILASVLLLVGGFMLVTRRRSATWWIGQAALANLLFTAAETYAHVHELDRQSSELRSIFEEALVRSQVEQPELHDAGVTGADLLGVYRLFLIGLGVARVLVYLAIAYRVRKPDAIALLTAGEHET